MMVNLLVAVLVSMRAFAAPVAMPVFAPDAGTWPAPLKVMIRCATPGAAVHITVDGKEPTQQDTEIDPDSSIVVDEPLTLKAKAWAPDGTASATQTAAYNLKPVQGNGASFLEQTVPALMAAGSPYKIAVAVRNIGLLPWGGDYALAAHRPKDGQIWSLVPMPPAKPTPTWGEATFTSRVTAPAAPGTYNLRFHMEYRGQPFGEPTPLVRVVVLSAEEYARQIKAQRANAATEGSKREPGSSTSKAPPKPLDSAAAAALARAKSRSDPATGATLDRLVGELQRSPRSFRYLRTIGLNQKDEEFAAMITTHGDLFREVRIVRRDERGQRITPGWPGIALKATSR
ncbi:MAG: hypothetical protein QOE70_325 [Chthoniobacter sp.]|jgi:hypothetical protein|nr:hypothetical protein [Chthoniobacter sp.]